MNLGAELELLPSGLAVPKTSFSGRVAVSGGGTDPNFGSGGFGAGTDVWWAQIAQDWVWASWSFIWGTGGNGGSGGSGVYLFELPTLMAAPNAARLADRPLGSAYLVNVGANIIAPMGEVFCVPTDAPTTGTTHDGKAPTATSWAKIVVAAPSSAGSATVLSGTTSVTVTHNMTGTSTPTSVQATPTSQPSTSGAIQWWCDTFTTSTFVLHASGAGGANLTSNLSFTWEAIAPTVNFGPVNPWTMGNLLDHGEFAILYPRG